MSDPNHAIVPKAETLPASTSGMLHPAVEKMLSLNPSAETLEKVLAMQEKWEANEAKKEFTRALVALKLDLPKWLERDTTVAFKDVRYTHVSLAGAMEVVLPHLTEHGFALTWKTAINEKDGKVVVTAVLTHRGGHSESTSLIAPPDGSGLKSGAQAVASSVTLLQRYTALALLGLATADMEDPKPDGARAESSEKIDSSKNLRAMEAITKAGKKKQEAETLIGKPIQKWTAADREKIKNWLTPAPAPAEVAADVPPPASPAPSSSREPGQDEAFERPPENPKDGDSWQDMVEVVSVVPQKQGTASAYFSIKIRDVKGKESEHNTRSEEVAKFAASIAGKQEPALTTFAAKLNREKTKLYINIEAMAIESADSLPF